jgi:hypothetical protein
MNVRNALQSEINRLAQIWYDGWRDAHEKILPEELARDRTLESFKVRLCATRKDVRVIGLPDEPVGFCIRKGDELYQLYVSRQSRGVGAAPPWSRMPKLASPNEAWRKLGSRAPSATSGLPDSTKGVDGIASET